MSSQVTLKALGLNFQPNQINVPEGSMTEAKNLIIRRDNILESRRGFKIYGNSFGSSIDRVKQLFAYKATILRHYANTLQYDSDGQGTFLPFTFNNTYTFTVTSASASSGAIYQDSITLNSFTVNTTISSATTLVTTGISSNPPSTSGTLTKISGSGDATITFSSYVVSGDSIIEAQTGVRTKSIESNGNFYFTSSEGIRKISAVTASNFTSTPGYITKAGGVKAIDLTAQIVAPVGTQTGFLPADSAVGYRTLWLTKDENQNLIQGTPSQPVQVYNFQLGLMLNDYLNMLGQLDSIDTTGSIIAYGQFVKNYGLTAGASANELQTELLALGSQLDFATEFASDAAATSTVPLKINSITLNNSTNLATVTFNGSPTLGNYFSVGDKIFLTSTSSTPNTTPVDGFAITNGSNVTFDSTSASNVDIVHNEILITSHGFVNGQPVQFTSSTQTLPTGINTGSTYYIINATTNSFQLSNTYSTTGATNSPITISALGTGTGGANSNVFVLASGSINGVQTITSVGSTTIQFSIAQPSTATSYVPIAGTVSVTSSKIISYKFETLNSTVGTNQPSSLALLDVTIPYTNSQIGVINDAISRYFTALQTLPIGIVSSTLQSLYLSQLIQTTNANVSLNISIPQDAQNPNYFLQIYRSDIVTATQAENLANLVPDDEMALVYEAYPTAAEIASKQMTVIDETPVAFEGANLYTNAFSGEGISQANDLPPYALDINKFAGSTFYANTKTRQRLQLQMLPVSNLINDFNAGNHPEIVISNGLVTNKYSFQLGVQEVQQVVCDTYANTSSHGFVILYSSDNISRYFFRLNKTAPSGNPAGFIVGTDVLVDIDISNLSGGTAPQLAQRLCDKINTQISDFTAVVSGSDVLVTNTAEGLMTSGSVNSLGGAWAISVITPGNGENTATNTILLSSLTSAAQAIDATARSMVRVINRNSTETIYAYYLSGANTVPGQMLLESRNINVPLFYLLASDSSTGQSFSPDLSPGTIPITGITNGVVTATAHGLTVGTQVVILETGTITGHDYSGLQTITHVTTNTFTVGNLTSSASTGVYIVATAAIFSSDEEKKNRIYYSKTDQPEAVPIVNYFDVGALDKAILRILPLRDSLFVFKEDGVYRVSGVGIPFTTTLFDSSCIVEAADSCAITNNIIYCWTSQGISTVTEAGVKFNISRPIDTDILKKATNQYTNFKTATWGMGYESDNSYLISTVVNTTDTQAQVTYRYSTLTNTWTTYDKNYLCGVSNISGDDKIYMGPGDVNYIEQERKDYQRTDYADRQYTITLNPNSYFGNVLQIPITNAGIGDVITQTPYITRFIYNGLLQKLDIDPYTVSHSLNNFYSSLNILAGSNMLTAMTALANKLDSSTTGGAEYIFTVTSANATLNSTYTDINGNVYRVLTTISGGTTLTTELSSGTSPTPTSGTLTKTFGTGDATITFSAVQVPFISLIGSGTDFVSIQGYYNAIINRINSDPLFVFQNYQTITNTTTYEVIIDSINTSTGMVTVNLALDFIQGDLILYKAIKTELTYCPSTLGDPLSLKHFREATVMFENKAFTSATLSFATDLLPAFNPIPVPGDGSGIFGENSWFGNLFFGGSSNSAPFRTLIPRDNQRCRYLVVRFNHTIARENFSLYGITLTGDITSGRAYR